MRNSEEGQKYFNCRNGSFTQVNDDTAYIEIIRSATGDCAVA